METKDGKTLFKVHTAVLATMETLSQHAECERGVTALGDLLNIVRNKLLVVALGPQTFGKGKGFDRFADTQVSVRSNAMALNEDLGRIIERGTREQAYWLKGKTCEDVSSFHTIQAVVLEADRRGSPTVPIERSSETIRGSLKTDSSSLVVPLLTGSLRVGHAQNSR